MSKKLGNGNSTPPTKKLKVCWNRSFELVYVAKEALLGNIIPSLTVSKYGVYKGFSVSHSYPNDPLQNHIHVGLILRDKPKDRSFAWGTPLIDYFTVLGVRPLVRPLKSKSTNLDNKLQTYYKYCTDPSLHSDQIIVVLNLHKFTPNPVGSTLTTKEFVLRQVIEGKSLNEIILPSITSRKASILYDFKSLNAMVTRYMSLTTCHTSYRRITEFNEDIRKRVLQWNHETHALVLRGPTSVGKTELAKSLLFWRTSKNPLFITNLNKLAHGLPHQPLLFDDMCFSETRRSKCISLLDLENDRDVRVMYGIVTILAGTARIFTTNEPLGSFFPVHRDPYGALSRRIHYLDVTPYGSLYPATPGGES